jgi:uncharacterized membrane protein
VDWRRVWREATDDFFEPVVLPFGFGWWSLVAVPVALVVGLVVLDLVGVITTLVIDATFGTTLGTYEEGETARVGDHLSFAAIGFGALAVGWTLSNFGMAIMDEWGRWSRAKERLKRDRREQREKWE